MRNMNTNSESYVLIESTAVENIINLWSPKRPLKCPPLCDSVPYDQQYKKDYNVSKLKTVLEVRGNLSSAPITPLGVQA